jgi:hypothetical protein
MQFRLTQFPPVTGSDSGPLALGSCGPGPGPARGSCHRTRTPVQPWSRPGPARDSGSDLSGQASLSGTQAGIQETASDSESSSRTRSQRLP